MKSIRIQFFLLSIFSILFNSCTNIIEGDIIISNVNIIDVENMTVIPNQTLTIEGNRISSIDEYSETDQLKALRIIDGTGKYVMPGLWDMHTHILYTYSESLTQIPNPEYIKNFNKLMIANGVTGFREMFCGDDAVKLFKKGILSGDYLPQRFIYANHIIDGDPPVWPFNFGVTTVNEAIALVDSLATTNTDFIKVYSKLSPEIFQAITKRCVELNIDVVGHIPNDVKPIDAIRAGMKSTEHLYGLFLVMSPNSDSILASGYNQKTNWRLLFNDQSDTAGTKLFELMKKKESWVVPTLTITNSIFKKNSSPYKIPVEENLKYIPYELEKEHWNQYKYNLSEEIYELRLKWIERLKEIIGIMHQQGVGFLSGTDTAPDNPFTYPGISLHDELLNLYESGLSNGETLKTATLNPAKYLNATDSLGTVAVNRMADLVILNKNPLDDIKNTKTIDGVLTDGKYFDRLKLDELLKEVEEAMKVIGVSE